MSPRVGGHRTLGYKDLVADFAETTILMPKEGSCVESQAVQRPLSKRDP